MTQNNQTKEEKMENELDRFRTTIKEALEKCGPEETMKMLIIASKQKNISGQHLRKALLDNLCSKCHGQCTFVDQMVGKHGCNKCEGSGHKNPSFGVNWDTKFFGSYEERVYQLDEPQD